MLQQIIESLQHLAQVKLENLQLEMKRMYWKLLRTRTDKN